MFHQVFTFSPILLPLQHVEGLNFKMSTELKGEGKKTASFSNWSHSTTLIPGTAANLEQNCSKE